MTSGKRLAVAIGIGLLTVFGSVSAAHAQYRARPYYGPPPSGPRGVYRSGLVLGGAIGPGVTSGPNCFSLCGFAGMGELHIGGMLNPRLALVGDVFAAARYWDDAVAGQTSAYSSIWTIGLQYWATNIIWLKGGFGWSNLQINDENTPGVSYNFSDEWGLGIMGAAGIEVVQSYNFALDLQLRAGHLFLDGGDLNQVAFLIGINWY